MTKETPLPKATVVGAAFQAPGLPVPQRSVLDARTHALYVLRQYMTDLTFYRPGPKGSKEAIAFKVPPSSFIIEWPDNEITWGVPAIVIVQAVDAEREGTGLGPWVWEEPVNECEPCEGVRNAKVVQHSHIETLQIELHAAFKPERRAMMAGCEVAFGMSEPGLRLRLPNYYNETARFTFLSSRLIEDDDSARRRRKALLNVQMEVNVVYPITGVTLRPEVDINVLAPDDDGLTRHE